MVNNGMPQTLPDARTLSPEAQEALRLRGVAMVVEQGLSQAEVSRLLKVTTVIVSRWMKKFRAGGWEALAKQTRGRRKEEQQKLLPWQCAVLVRLMTDKCPDQLKMPFVLWTREAVRQLILMKFSVELPVRTVGKYLARWGLTPQKPLRRARERQPAAIDKWLKETYPSIAKQAKAQGAEIQWGDQTGVNNTAAVGKSYAPAGQRPVISATAKRFSISMISKVTHQGSLRFMLYPGAMNVAIFLKFLRRLVRDGQARRRKIFLVLDNLPVHHARLVKDYLTSVAEHLEVFYLPSYAPELNPDEQLHSQLKSTLGHRRAAAKNQADLSTQLQSVMRSIQKQPARIKTFFQHPDTQYAA